MAEEFSPDAPQAIALDGGRSNSRHCELNPLSIPVSATLYRPQPLSVPVVRGSAQSLDVQRTRTSAFQRAPTSGQHLSSRQSDEHNGTEVVEPTIHVSDDDVDMHTASMQRIVQYNVDEGRSVPQ